MSDRDAMLKRWVRYAESRRKPVPKPPAPAPVKGWWSRWTQNLDALEAKLNPHGAHQRRSFRHKQRAKAQLDRVPRKRRDG